MNGIVMILQTGQARWQPGVFAGSEQEILSKTAPLRQSAARAGQRPRPRPPRQPQHGTLSDPAFAIG